jgi:hypothetical protein
MAKSTPKSSKKEVKPSKTPAKAASKAPAKTAAGKKDQKPAPKKGAEKKIEKAPAKHHVAPKTAAAKPVPKKGAPVKAVAKAPVKTVEAKKTETKKIGAVVAEVKKAKAEKAAVAPQVGAKASKVAPKKKGTGKKEEFDLEEDLVGEGDDFASDELSEYQAELESAEEELEEKEIPVEEAAVPVVPQVSKEKSDDIILTDAEGRRYCRVKDCDQVATVDGYCRYHYLLLWKKIQVRKKILTDGKLERYIEELTSRYPDKFLEVIRRDLRTEKDFVSAIQEMEIDESGGDNDFEDESSNFIDEVRGASPEGIAEDDEY